MECKHISGEFGVLCRRELARYLRDVSQEGDFLHRCTATGQCSEGIQPRQCSSVQHEGSSSPYEHKESRPCACLHRSG